MDAKFLLLLNRVEDRARELRRNGRRCCANQVLLVVAELGSEFAEWDAKLEIARREARQRG